MIEFSLLFLIISYLAMTLPAWQSEVFSTTKMTKNATFASFVCSLILTSQTEGFVRWTVG